MKAVYGGSVTANYGLLTTQAYVFIFCFAL